jgi:hypothetical protein
LCKRSYNGKQNITKSVSSAYEQFNKQSNNFVSLTPRKFGDALETTHLTTVEWHDPYVNDEVENVRK